MFRSFEFLSAKLHGVEKEVTEWVTGTPDVENGTWFGLMGGTGLGAGGWFGDWCGFCDRWRSGVGCG